MRGSCLLSPALLIPLIRDDPPDILEGSLGQPPNTHTQPREHGSRGSQGDLREVAHKGPGGAVPSGLPAVTLKVSSVLFSARN